MKLYQFMLSWWLKFMFIVGVDEIYLVDICDTKIIAQFTIDQKIFVFELGAELSFLNHL
jgi:hypothetical protein